MELWEVIDTGCKSAEENMRFDASLLENADRYPRPVLHLYDWEGDCATYGHFIEPGELLDLERVREKGLHLAKRPTGGGIIFHIWDMAFSVLIPAHCPEFSMNTLENYAFVNTAVLEAVEKFLTQVGSLHLIAEDIETEDAACRHFCMAKPTKYDVLKNSKKVAGAAQRKTKKGFLHQGSISLALPDPNFLDAVLLAGSSVRLAMQNHTCPLLGPSATAQEIQNARGKLKLLLATQLNDASLKYHSLKRSAVHVH